MSTATATRPNRTAKKYGTYDTLRSITEKPLDKRRELPIGRGGETVVPRKFHNSLEEIKELRASHKENKRIPNPHNRGFYFYAVEALIDAGVNEKHTQSAIVRRMETLMSAASTENSEGVNAWKRFTDKDPRNSDTGKDVDGRIDQNLLVMQRLTGRTPYGLKLLEVGTEVLGTKGVVLDIFVSDTGTRYLRLNTNSNRPINETKTRGMGSPAALKAEKAAKRGKKSRKPKSKVAKTNASDAAPAEAVVAV